MDVQYCVRGSYPQFILKVGTEQIGKSSHKTLCNTLIQWRGPAATLQIISDISRFVNKVMSMGKTTLGQLLSLENRVSPLHYQFGHMCTHCFILTIVIALLDISNILSYHNI